MTRVLLTAEAPFEAARRINGGWEGHSFRLRVRATPEDGLEDAEGLARLCTRAVAPADRSLLNEAMGVTGDAELLRALEERLRAEGVSPRRLALRSAPDRGVAQAGEDAWQWRAFRFEAAHRLPYVPEGHPCARMHGHGYRVVLEARGLDADQLAVLWAPVGAELDHACLNEILENPTSERLAAWLWRRLRAQHGGLRRVHVQESEHSGCSFDGGQYSAWKAQRLEAATRRRGGADHRGRLHGHGYRLRLWVSAPLDEERGWAMDFGDIKAAFAPLREALDHHRLDEIAGLEQGDVGTLARWIAERTARRLPELQCVDVDEQEGLGARAELGAG